MNPVNDYLGPLIEQLFRPLIDEDYLRLAYGGADVGGHLVRHPAVDVVHITGSVHTFDAIVFGSGDEGHRRKKANQPILAKPITSELGGVVPVIVVPGPWEAADIAYQAENIVTMKLHNAGSNCVSAQSLILSESWPQAPELVAEVRQLMERLPPRPASYPGAAERQAAAVARYPGAELLCADSRRMLIADIDADAQEQHCFQEEFFCPILAETTLPGGAPSAFLQNAVRFCNQRLFGTLGVTILIHPKTAETMGPVLEAAIDELRYGAVGVNVWCAGAFLLAQAAWGGFPGQPMNDIQSGSGFAHNSLMFDKPQKTVVRGSFYASPRSWLHGDFHIAPKPLWFVTNRTAETTARRVAQFAADPQLGRLPAIFLSALRG
jgi:aldehyde dehydrogenase (NAD(P)+)